MPIGYLFSPSLFAEWSVIHDTPFGSASDGLAASIETRGFR